MSERTGASFVCAIASVLVCVSMLASVAQEPRSAEQYLKRAIQRHNARDLDGAIEDYTKAILLNVSTWSIKQLKSIHQNDRPMEFSDRFLVMDHFNAWAYYYRGNARLYQGDFKGAIGDLDKVIAVNPHNGRALNNRGCARHRAGDIDGAMDDFNRALRLEPRNALAYNNRGMLRYDVKDFGGAVADYTRAIEIDPGYAVAYHNRANAYKALGNVDAAFTDYDKATELDSTLGSKTRNR